MTVRAEHPDPIVYAVLTGMAARIERGDFDKDERGDRFGMVQGG